ncbi:TIGR02757 family protein [Gracilimonas mengyeensis]|uniref:TIGR02757 family protein n=1 Tax=Gracilimonas mengyeensis TaxID=1302730 RepID=A0A521EPG3_9BACT|nr:TIGR02757 family protein [Gracilimonas mengyeensis]SMO85806.1 TIGR02757 family protein [Gracilimonas mengyeensis]
MPRRKKLRILSKKKLLQLKPFLDNLVKETETSDYIHDDPIQFMHAFEGKDDQELAGFFAATMAWGRRDIVNAKVEDLLKRMDYRPAAFITQFSEKDARRLEGFKHRTFKPVDMYWLIKSLQSILQKFGHFEGFWKHCYNTAKRENRQLIAVFHQQFFTFHPEMPRRTRKHVSNTEKNSSAKRLYMYLRWCIRQNSPVDLGIMQFMSPAELKIPLDVHVARQARKLGLLSRKQNDWKAVLELNNKLKVLDPEDPAKYDFALFGLGVLEEEIPSELVMNTSVD